MSWSVSKYIHAVESGKLDQTLIRLYGRGELDIQRQRYFGLCRRMEKWAADGNCLLLSVPGRTELGGNHTDHNNGVVLAAAVHFDCLAIAMANATDTIRIQSSGFAETIEVNLRDLEPRKEEEGTSTALVRGVAYGFAAAGYELGGLDACVVSDVPIGAGLSSSAAFEVCVAQMFNQLFNKGNIPVIELARISREAENVHFGKPCGFMDQIACAEQGILSIDFADQAKPMVKRVNFDFDSTGYHLVVVDTGGDHASLTPEYAAIPEEMRKAAQALGREAARGITLEEVVSNASMIRRNAGDRGLLRLIHFIRENERAQAQAAALSRGDMEGFLKLVHDSGDSSWRLLQNCISTSHAHEQPIPVGLTLTELFLKGEGAWRVQGGGFAGSIQAYVPRHQLDEYCVFMGAIYGPGAVVPLRLRQPGDEVLSLNGIMEKS